MIYNLLVKIIFKLFLVKEIVSRTGVLHFRRFRVISTPWFKIYLHKIYASDREAHMHDHPYDFMSLVLKGSYKEYYAIGPKWGEVKEKIYRFLQVNSHNHEDIHKVEIIDGPVWTLFFVGKKTYDWGYQTELGFMSHERYRSWKRNGYPKNYFF